MQGFHGDGARRCGAGNLLQAESLKSLASLVILKHLHNVAENIEATYGDKSAEKTNFIIGIQGKVSR